MDMDNNMWFLIIFYHFNLCLPHQGRIPIGVIFDTSDKTTKTGLLFGVQRYNAQPEKTFELSAVVDVVNVADSFELASSICTHMTNGVFLLFGSLQFESSNIIQAYSETFEMPYVTPSLSEYAPHTGSRYQVHMKPSNTKALVDIITEFGWRNFHYIYDSEDGLFSLQEILRMLESDRYIANVKMRYLQDTHNVHEDLRALDRLEEQDNATEKYIVINLSNESAYFNVMKQIREVGMNKEGYHYILGTLDFLSLDMERYQHGGVNITGFQLVNYTSKYVKNFLKVWRTLDRNIWPGGGNDYISIDAALSYDAITIITKTLALFIVNAPKVFKHTFRRGDIYNNNKTRGVPCNTDPPVPWMHGIPLMKGMRTLRFEGVTGNVEFDGHGFRKNYDLDVYNVGLQYGPEKIGQWSSETGFKSNGDNDTLAENGTVTGKVYIVTSIEDEPFLMIKGLDKNGKPFLGNDRYEGYCVDLTKKVAEYVNFDYKITLVKDNNYGKKFKNGTWNGMVGEIVRGEADLAVAPLSITSDRELVVDFSKPFMNIGISIMIKKPEKKKPGVFSFLQPFTINLWMCIVLGYIFVGLGIFVVSRFSSAEWRRTGIPDTTINKFNLANSLWFSMGSLMLQGSDDACPSRTNTESITLTSGFNEDPVRLYIIQSWKSGAYTWFLNNCSKDRLSVPGRIIGGAWWFVVLIMISSYTANLAAFLTIEKMLTPIESADDLVSQSEISYGTLDSGSTQAFFRNTKVSTYKIMWNYMSSMEPTVFVSDIEKGIQRVRESKGKYAFLLESVYNEYANNRKPCDTMKVGPHLNHNHYGIATRKYSRLRDDITLAVLSLTEDGTLQMMKKTWWVEKGECGFDTGHRESKKRSLSLSNVAGAYFILIAGLVLSIIVGVVEFVYSKNKPERTLPEGVYLFPTETTVTLAESNHVNEKNSAEENATAQLTPTINGKTKTSHFSYDTSFNSPPKISFQLDPNTDV